MKRLKLTLLAILFTVGAAMLCIATSPQSSAAAPTCGNTECAPGQSTCEFITGSDCNLSGGTCQGNVPCPKPG